MGNNAERINKLIHDEILPIQNMFKSYKQLSYNPAFHFNGGIFDKCIRRCQELIEIARELVKNGEVTEKCNG